MIPTSAPRRVTLEELIALNDEIQMLSRAGVPLESGLVSVARDAGGRFRRLGATIAERLAAGVTWEHIVREHADVIPPVYGAVVEAGLRTGHLPIAIENLTSSLRRLTELRRSYRLALFYPLLLLVVAYGFLVAEVVLLWPFLVEMYADMGLLNERVHHFLLSMIAQVRVWAPIPLVALAALVSARSALGILRRRTRLGAGLALRGVARMGRLAVFTELLALLVAQQTPLDRSLELAGQASGDQGLADDADRLAQAVRAGVREVPPVARRGLPPLLWAILLTEQDGRRLTQVLRREATATARRARVIANRWAVRFPLMLAIVFGGLTALGFGLIVLGPWYWLLFHLAQVP